MNLSIIGGGTEDRGFSFITIQKNLFSRDQGKKNHNFIIIPRDRRKLLVIKPAILGYSVATLLK